MLLLVYRFCVQTYVFSSLKYIPLFLCIDHWGRLSYVSLLFFGTLHSNGNIFPFLLCFSLLFFSQLFVRALQCPFGQIHSPYTSHSCFLLLFPLALTFLSLSLRFHLSFPLRGSHPLLTHCHPACVPFCTSCLCFPATLPSPKCSVCYMDPPVGFCDTALLCLDRTSQSEAGAADYVYTHAVFFFTHI